MIDGFRNQSEFQEIRIKSNRLSSTTDLTRHPFSTGIELVVYSILSQKIEYTLPAHDPSFNCILFI